jgi:hypothetical protein
LDRITTSLFDRFGLISPFMIRGTSSSRTGNKAVSSDLVATLGFLNVKVPLPSAVDRERFAPELFFNNYCRPELSCVMTADHIEHGFHAIGKAAHTAQLSELQRLIDHFFIFSFCSIIVGDGKERARAFLERQANFSAFPPEFLQALAEIEPNEVDNHQEILQFLMKPCSTEFSLEFYRNLDTYLNENQVPGMIYLLKHFLHDESHGATRVPAVYAKDNHSVELQHRTDQLLFPFNESNVPRVVHRTHKYNEFKTTRNVPSLFVKHSTARPVQLPSLTSMTVPPDSLIAAMDPCSPAVVYGSGNELFYVSAGQELCRLRPHVRSVSVVTFSSCGRFILSADVCGDIRVQTTSGDKFTDYEPARESVTAVTFEGPMFAVGTLSGRIYLYQTDERHTRRVFLLHTAGVTFLSIHPNYEYLASTSIDGLIRLYSISMGTCARVWKLPKALPLACRFSHDGKMLLTVASDGSLTILDLGANKVFRTIPIEAAVIDAVFSPTDHMIAVVDKTGGFSLWDTNNVSAESLTVLRIGRIRPLAHDFFDRDEVRVLGCAAPHRAFDDGLATF